MRKLMVIASCAIGMQFKGVAQAAPDSQGALPLPSFPHKRYVTYHDLETDIEKVYTQLPKQKWEGIIAVARGGLYPALFLAHKLDIRRLESISLASYDDDKKQSNIKMLQSFNFKDKNEGLGWIIVDDLSDTGHTLLWLRKYLPKAHYAVIYTKPKGKQSIDTYGAEVDQGTWIEFPWENK